MVLPPKRFWGSRILAPFPGQRPLKRSSRAGFQALVLEDIAFCYKKRDLGDTGEVWVNGDVPGVELSIAPRNSGTRNQPHILADEMPTFVSAVHQLGDSLCRWSLRSVPLGVGEFSRTDHLETVATRFVRYFKLYKSQIAVIEQALETAALMLGTGSPRALPSASAILSCAESTAFKILPSG